MQQLDPDRVKRLLLPWLSRTSRQFDVLTDPKVREIIASAVEAGASEESIRDGLSPFFGQDVLNEFMGRFQMAILGFGRIPAKRAINPPFSKGSGIHRNVPASFLSSQTVSLKHADQTVKKLILDENGQEIDEEGNPIHRRFVLGKEKPKNIKVRAKPTTRDFSFLSAEKMAKGRAERALTRSVAAGYPLFDAIAIQRDVVAPVIDWWDAPFVEVRGDEWAPVLNVNCDYENAPPVAVPQRPVREVPTMMTDRERKRVRHISRLEKRNEERLLIKLNLREKDPVKIKTGQMINFSGGKAPTEVEMEVRKAQDERLRKHSADNESRKLTAEQKHEKKVRKRREDGDKAVTVSVFALTEPLSALQSASLSRLAENWFMTGGIFMVGSPAIHFAVIESGPKGIRKLDAFVKRKMCSAVRTFYGPATKRSFFNFRKYVFDVGTQCRSFFGKVSAEEMFDAAARSLPCS